MSLVANTYFHLFFLSKYGNNHGVGALRRSHFSSPLIYGWHIRKLVGGCRFARLSLENREINIFYIRYRSIIISQTCNNYCRCVTGCGKLQQVVYKLRERKKKNEKKSCIPLNMIIYLINQLINNEILTAYDSMSFYGTCTYIYAKIQLKTYLTKR